MRKLTLFLAFAVLSGCATQTYKAAEQNYRPKGADTSVKINGALFVKPGAFDADRAVGIYFNDSKQIVIPIDRNGNGEASGATFGGKPTSAACSGRPVSSNSTEVRCMVFIDNERTVTLTF